MTIEYAKCGLCGGPTYQRKDSADVYHAACLRKIYPKCTLGNLTTAEPECILDCEASSGGEPLRSTTVK